MCERQAFGVEEKTAEIRYRIPDVDISDGIIAAFVVDRVADDGVINVCQMDADLMCAAGFDIQVKQAGSFEPLLYRPKAKSVTASLRDAHFYAVMFVTCDGSIDFA